MSYKSPEEIQKRVQEHYDWAVGAGYEVVAVFLQGSWNYSSALCDDQSDVDTKCWVLPTLEDLALRKKPKSFTHLMENEEHCDIKDLYEYMTCFKKQNVNFVEVLFTDYYVINPKYADLVQELIDNREKIAHYDPVAALHCMVGMIYQKQKALCHRYEGLKDKIDKYGYDGKQLSHAVRMKIMIAKYLQGMNYEDCLHLSDKEGAKLLALKRHLPWNGHDPLTVEEAQNFMELTLRTAQSYIRSFFASGSIEQDYKEEIETLFNNFVIQSIKRFFKIKN